MDPQTITVLATRIRRAYQALDNCATDDADRALKELMAAALAGVPPDEAHLTWAQQMVLTKRRSAAAFRRALDQVDAPAGVPP
jgi:hypothetical protein